MARLLVTLVLGLATACTNTAQEPIPLPAATAASTREISVASPGEISVEIRFPESQTLVVHDVTGQVTDDAGNMRSQLRRDIDHARRH